MYQAATLIPMALPRSFGGNAEVRIAMPVEKIMAVPRPCSTRNVSKAAVFHAAAQSNDETVTIDMPQMNTFRRP